MNKVVMPKLITELTPEQEAMLPAFREKWRAIGLNTDPIDRQKAERSIKNLYKIAGEDEPIVLFFDSPAACLISRALLQKTELFVAEDQLVNQLRGQLWNQLMHQFWDQLGGQPWDQLWNQLRVQLEGELGGQLVSKLRDQLRDQFRGQLEDQFRGQLEDQLRGRLWKVHDSLWFIGGWDNFWLAFYKFGQEIGVAYKNQDHLDAYTDYATEAGVMYAYKGIAFASDRAEKLSFDDERRLHCENDYAMKFRDGYGLCSWHGVRVPDEWILSKSLDAKTALAQQNMEQRRVACEIVGWNNILLELKAKRIDKHDNPFVGELLEVELPDIGREVFLKVKCPTGRDFAMPVPPHIKTSEQAQRWLRPVPSFCEDNLITFMPKRAR